MPTSSPTFENQVATLVEKTSADLMKKSSADAAALGGSAVVTAIFASEVYSALPPLPNLDSNATPDQIASREAICNQRDKAFEIAAKAEQDHAAEYARVKTNAASAVKTISAGIIAIGSAVAVKAALGAI